VFLGISLILAFVFTKIAGSWSALASAWRRSPSSSKTDDYLGSCGLLTKSGYLTIVSDCTATYFCELSGIARLFGDFTILGLLLEVSVVACQASRHGLDLLNTAKSSSLKVIQAYGFFSFYKESAFVSHQSQNGLPSTGSFLSVGSWLPGKPSS
jgi:hypothetical protein